MRYAAGLITAVLFVGVLVRLTVRDSASTTALLFYASPLPVLATLSLLRLGCSLLLKQKRRSIAWLLITAVMLTWCSIRTVRWQDPGEAPRSLRIVCWNVARSKGRWKPEIADIIHRSEPDIIGLVEAGGSLQEQRAYWAKHFPDWNVVSLGQGLVCLTQHAVGQGRGFDLAHGGYAGQVEVLTPAGEFTVVVVDIKSDPFRSREEPLRALARHADGLAGRPAVIMGDFNTPADSVLFEPLRAGHRNVFDIAGRGYAATWPVPAPVLHLDQMWTNPNVQPLTCEHQWTAQSDHCPVIADVAIVLPESAVRDD